ncbi:hypothetical protein [Paenibacillus sp. An7]|uniref:hypothetical protein n=1 Tax=Paenibacillus sp. An7 TaxID=2689577 RepID=UPI001F1A80E8|nr:hypothetical protein [Paenibacillus sp. An7]
MKKMNSQGMQSSQGFQTPNEKYDAEFGQEMNSAAEKVKQSSAAKVQDNYQTPDEKYDAEFGVENTGIKQQQQQQGQQGQQK